MQFSSLYAQGLLLLLALLPLAASAVPPIKRDPAIELGLPAQRPRILLSRGLSMQRIIDPEQLPRTFAEIDENSLRTVVPSGKLLMVFEGRTLGANQPRVLAVTEDGVWGYIQLGNPGLVADEPALREIHDSPETTVILRREVTVHIPARPDLAASPTIPATFTRGETYEMISGDDWPGRIRVSPDKRDHIIKQGGSPPEYIDLPEGSLVTVDVKAALPAGVQLSKARPNTLSEYAQIYRTWRNAREVRQLRGTRKDCGVTQSVSVTRETGSSAKVDLGLGANVDQIKEILSANIGLDISYAAKVAQTFKEMREEAKNVELALSAWIIDGTEGKPVLALVERKNWDDGCASAKDTWFYVNYGSATRKVIRPSGAETPALGRSYRPASGTLDFTCYSDAVSTVDELVVLGLNEQAASFVAAQIGRVHDWGRFMSVGCKSE